MAMQVFHSLHFLHFPPIGIELLFWSVNLGPHKFIGYFDDPNLLIKKNN